MMAKQSHSDILSMGFNQDQECFACSTQRGFRIFNSLPFKETFERDLEGSVGIVEMLFRCNILALVGGGATPKWPLNKVVLWDDHQLKTIGELSFKSYVKNVKMRKDKVIVVLENRIYVYNFSDLKLIEAIDTCPNPKGLVAVNPHNDRTVIAAPDKPVGSIRVVHYENNLTTIIPQAH